MLKVLFQTIRINGPNVRSVYYKVFFSEQDTFVVPNSENANILSTSSQI
jgi:hypothetical protein